MIQSLCEGYSPILFLVMFVDDTNDPYERGVVKRIDLVDLLADREWQTADLSAGIYYCHATA